MEKIFRLSPSVGDPPPCGWETLPDFPLYMDQVLSYMERQTIRLDESDALTASMVNNYTKNALSPGLRARNTTGTIWPTSPSSAFSSR